MALVAVLLPLAAVGVLFRRVYRNERDSALPPSHGFLLTSTRDANVPGMRDVTIPVGAAYHLGAWYVPPTRGSLVIVAHGTGADRSHMLPDVRVLQAAGIGVLAFDWPGHGMSEGESHWGAPERAALSAVVTWALAQPGVDPAQLGVLGFSYGGYIVAQAAAADERLRRVALVATPSDATAQTYAEYAQWTPLAGWLAMRSIRLLGIEPDTLKAQDQVGRFSPRPLLLVTGALDPAVPTRMADTLFVRAHEPKTLLRIPGATHGDYMAVDSAAYAAALRLFFAPADTAVTRTGGR
jgi:dipeptidyl aminopeptidase/acylaminoacyl peptidase